MAVLEKLGEMLEGCHFKSLDDAEKIRGEEAACTSFTLVRVSFTKVLNCCSEAIVVLDILLTGG